MALNEDVVQSVTNSNFKTVAEGPASFHNMLIANSYAHQNRMSIVAEAATASAVKQLTEIDPIEAVSALKVTSGNEVASTISQLLAALGSGQQQAKVAQTTPPETGR